MKSTFLGMLALLSLAVSALARDPAQVRIYCTSVQLLPATGGPGQIETLDVTTDPSFGEINNELSPLQEVPVFFRLDDPTSAETIDGQIAIVFPPPVDNNGNGFDDFFEVSQAVAPTTTEGAFGTVVDSGAVRATWSRAAGATTGTCVVQMTGQIFGQLPAFTHTFELIEYTGTLAYVPATNLITGDLLLRQTGTPSNTLSGQLNFTRVDTNRFNQLTLLAGTLTNAASQSLSFDLGEIDRDEILKTNYFGYVTFADGDPNTGTADYRGWVASIDDPNDANADGFPDLSDDVATAPPQAPRLTLVRSKSGLLLSIAGAVGQTYDLQEAALLSVTNWSTALSVTLTNSPQPVPLAQPAASNLFWRAKAP